MSYYSRCRNCPCLHFFGADNGDYGINNYPHYCYCPELSNGIESRCFNYAPSDNLEWLEWVIEQEEKNGPASGR